MLTSRFFRIFSDEAYESSRLALDAARGLTGGETTYEPLATAQRDSNGNALLAIRSMHCELPDIAAAISQMLANGWGVEIDEATYLASLPQPSYG